MYPNTTPRLPSATAPDRTRSRRETAGVRRLTTAAAGFAIVWSAAASDGGRLPATANAQRPIVEPAPGALSAASALLHRATHRQGAVPGRQGAMPGQAVYHHLEVLLALRRQAAGATPVSASAGETAQVENRPPLPARR